MAINERSISTTRKMYSSLFLPLSCSTYTYRGRAVLVSHVVVITPMGQGTAPAQIPPRNVSVFYRNTVYRPSTAALRVIVSVCMRCGQTSMHKKTARPYVWAFYEPPPSLLTSLTDQNSFQRVPSRVTAPSIHPLPIFPRGDPRITVTRHNRAQGFRSSTISRTVHLPVRVLPSGVGC